MNKSIFRHIYLSERKQRSKGGRDFVVLCRKGVEMFNALHSCLYQLDQLDACYLLQTNITTTTIKNITPSINYSLKKNNLQFIIISEIIVNGYGKANFLII